MDFIEPHENPEWERVRAEAEPTLGQLRAELALMRDQILRLRGLRTNREIALLDWFGLSPAEARILGDLFEANGKPVAYKGLCYSIQPSHRVTLNSIYVHVLALREAIGRPSILTVRGFGYQLSASGLDECREAVKRWERFS